MRLMIDVSLFQRFHSLTIYRSPDDQHPRQRLRQVRDQIVKAIQERSSQVVHLIVRVEPGTVVVHGETKTYYQRQLVDTAVLHYIKRFAGEFVYDIHVLVR